MAYDTILWSDAKIGVYASFGGSWGVLRNPSIADPTSNSGSWNWELYTQGGTDEHMFIGSTGGVTWYNSAGFTAGMADGVAGTWTINGSTYSRKYTLGFNSFNAMAISAWNIFIGTTGKPANGANVGARCWTTFYKSNGVLFTVNYTVANNTINPKSWAWVPTPSATINSGGTGTISFMGTQFGKVLTGYAPPGTLIPIPTGWVDNEAAIHEPMYVTSVANNNVWTRQITSDELAPASGPKIMRLHTTNTSLSNQTLNIAIGSLIWSRFIPGIQADPSGLGGGQDYFEFTIPADIVAKLPTNADILVSTVPNASYPSSAVLYKFTGKQFTDTTIPFEGWCSVYDPAKPPTFVDPPTGEKTGPGGTPLPPTPVPPSVIPPDNPIPIPVPNPTPNPTPPPILPNPPPTTPGGGSSGNGTTTSTFPGQDSTPNPANIAQGVYDGMTKRDKDVKQAAADGLSEQNNDTSKNGGEAIQEMIDNATEKAQELSDDLANATGLARIPSEVAPIQIENVWAWMNFSILVQAGTKTMTHVFAIGDKFVQTTAMFASLTQGMLTFALLLLVGFEILAQVEMTFKSVFKTPVKVIPKFAISLWGFSDGGLISWLVCKAAIIICFMSLAWSVTSVFREFMANNDLAGSVPWFVSWVSSLVSGPAGHSVQLFNYFFPIHTILSCITLIILIRTTGIVKRFFIMSVTGLIAG